ncbi:hypothetical protein [Desulfovibrio sp. ZJ200]|uniref:hypothetical protein n=1 Tax=Desulfovibrio sp. ZJ200 TaxID=2709792 RepID=UPI0013EA7B13|nr:hypothetical protein [Desulfovibrio sp. ZJ200]
MPPLRTACLTRLNSYEPTFLPGLELAGRKRPFRFVPAAEAALRAMRAPMGKKNISSGGLIGRWSQDFRAQGQAGAGRGAGAPQPQLSTSARSSGRR